MADSTTINFFKLSVAALRHQVGRSQIVSDNLNFLSDLYSLSESVALLDAGHELTLWDLSHSVGSVDVRLGECEADLAVGCTYDNVRVGFAPLYTSFGDVFEVVDRMARVVEGGLYRRHLDTDITVT